MFLKLFRYGENLRSRTARPFVRKYSLASCSLLGPVPDTRGTAAGKASRSLDYSRRSWTVNTHIKKKSSIIDKCCEEGIHRIWKKRFWGIIWTVFVQETFESLSHSESFLVLEFIFCLLCILMTLKFLSLAQPLLKYRFLYSVASSTFPFVYLIRSYIQHVQHWYLDFFHQTCSFALFLSH